MNNFEDLFSIFFNFNLNEENMKKKPSDLSIDSIKFWEFIDFLETKFNIEYDLIKISNLKNFEELKKLTKELIK